MTQVARQYCKARLEGNFESFWHFYFADVGNCTLLLGSTHVRISCSSGLSDALRCCDCCSFWHSGQLYSSPFSNAYVTSPSSHWRGKNAIKKMHTCVNWYFVSPGYSRTLATVLSSAKNTTTDRMRACMKINKTQLLL